MNKKLLSWMIALLIMVLVCAINPIGVKAAGWDGTVATSFAGGDGGASNPYLIETPGQLAYFMSAANYSASYYKIIADIDMNNQTLTTPLFYFYGTLDGSGKTVNNLNLNVPLSTSFDLYNGAIGFICNLGGGEDAWGNKLNGTVKDLGLAGTLTNSAGNTANLGGLVGEIESGSKVLNCFTNINIVANDIYTGGIAGMNWGTIANCYSRGTVAGLYYTGGIVGWAKGTSNVINCYSTSAVSYTTLTQYTYVGGVIGFNDGTAKYLYTTNSTIIGRSSVSATGCATYTAANMKKADFVTTLNNHIADADSGACSWKQVTSDYPTFSYPDTVAPMLTTVTMSSNNTNDNTRAKVGDIVTVTIVSNEDITSAPTVAIAGQAATVTGSGTNWTATYTVAAGVSGSSLSISNFSDASGNAGLTVTAVTSGNITTVDGIAPTITAGTVVRTLDSTAVIKFTPSEAGSYYYKVVDDGAAAPDVDTSGTGVSCTAAETTLTVTDLTDGSAKDIYIAVKDLAGNVGIQKIDIVAELPATIAEVKALRTSSSEATVKFSTDQDGVYYYTVVDDGADEPGIDTSGAGTACTTGTNTISLTGLTLGAKAIYIYVKDEGENLSNKLKINIPSICVGYWSDYAENGTDDIEISADGLTYTVKTAEGLAWIAAQTNKSSSPERFLDKTVLLANDLDLSAHFWVPIGNYSAGMYYFNGTFDGQEHNIYGMVIGSEATPDSSTRPGLFGYVSGKGSIKNLNMSGAVIYTKAASSSNPAYAGIIAGYLEYTATISKCSVSGKIINSGSSACIGGVAGSAGNISDTSFSGEITSDAAAKLGGLVGKVSAGTIQNCTSTGTISCTAASGTVGGLIGTVESATISGCSSDCNVSSASSSSVGGLVGSDTTTWGYTTTYSNCYAKGNVTGSDSSNLGGLIGYSDIKNGTIESCYATGNVTSNGNKNYMGGLIGMLKYKAMNNCYATGDVTSTGTGSGDNMGGLLGWNSGALTGCYAIGDVTSAGTGQEFVGGLAGQNSGALTSCYAAGNVTGTGTNSYVGGLAGTNNQTLTGCYATGNVTGTGKSECLGGLLGQSSGALTGCYAAGSITGTNTGIYAGGLIGYTSYNFTVKNCYATGDVSIAAGSAGGFIGQADKLTISNAYSRGNVCVTGSTGNIGGFCGYYKSGTLSYCYWNSDAVQSSNGSTLDSTSKKGVGSGTDSTTSETLAYMQSADFVSLLNTNSGGGVTWKIKSATINNGCPVIDSVGDGATAASGITASVAAKSTPENGKVMLTISTAVSGDAYKIYYRVVGSDPSAPNVGGTITVGSWIENSSGTSAFEVSATDGKYIEVVEITSADSKITKWGKTTVTDDGYTAPVSATGITASTAAKSTPENGKVMLTISTAVAGDGYKIYYRVVDSDPSAPNVGDTVTVADWTENTSGTSAFEASAADGKYIEVIEITSADSKITKWGKTAATDDGYTVSLADQPESQATDLYYSNNSNTDINLHFTAPATASGYLVVRKIGAEPIFVPVDGTAYTAGAQGDEQIVYVGTEPGATDAAAAAGSEYYYKIYAYNGSGETINYLTSNPLSGQTQIFTGSSDVYADRSTGVSSTASVGAGFPGVGVSISFPNGISATNFRAYKYNSVAGANFYGVPGSGRVKSLYFEVKALDNDNPGTYTMVIDFSSLSGVNWDTYQLMKRNNYTGQWEAIGEDIGTIVSRATDGVAGKFTISGLSGFSEFAGCEPAATHTVTSISDSGEGTLRNVLASATEGDTIQFADALAGATITLASPLVMDKSVNIIGPDNGITLNGNNACRVITLDNSANNSENKLNVRLENLKIQNGNDSAYYAGGLYATYINTWLSLVNCVVAGNQASGTNADNYGGVGGISMENPGSYLFIANSTITGNQGAAQDGGAGGIYAGGNVRIYNSIIYGNSGESNNVYFDSNSEPYAYNSLFGDAEEDVYLLGAGDGFPASSDNLFAVDPKFVGSALASDHPYMLYGESPCIDSGDNSYAATDYDLRGSGYGRKMDKSSSSAGTADMGAYEYQYGSDYYAPISFDSQGGTTVSDVKSAVYGGTISAPSAPVKEGYSFEGWYKEAECINEWIFDSDTVTAARTLYAKWNAQSGDATLSSLSLSEGTLSPDFDPATTGYTASVDNSVNSITVIPSVNESHATVKVNDTAVVSGEASDPVNLNVGENTITIEVTAQDNTTKTYTITVTRAEALSGDATLSSMSLSEGTLSPDFDPATTGYTTSVGNSVNSITVIPSVNESHATVKVNGTAVVSGEASDPVSLSVGENTITIEVTAQDNSSKTYTIIVTRAEAQSGDATLSSLSLSEGTLNPDFDPATTGYTASVGNSVNSITVTPSVNESHATVKVNGTAVVSGEASDPVSLSVGENTITIEVTAQDNSSKTYTIIVTRAEAQSGDATLSSLSLSEGTLSPDFDPATTGYTASVGNSVNSITVIPSVNESHATVKVNDTAVVSGSPSGDISLSVGENTITIEVTAQDNTRKTYTITVTRAEAQSGDATLSSLSLSEGTLSPDFDPATTGYTASVGNSVNSITVIPSVNESHATVKVNDTAVVSGSPSGDISLSVGENTITIEVTAQDNTRKTYTITVTRAEAQSGDATLSSLSLSEGTLSPDFDPATTSYTASVGNSVSSLSVTPSVNESHATVKVNGTAVVSGEASDLVNLNVGENTITIEVTAQDNTTNTYIITVTRAAAQSEDVTLSSLSLSEGTLSPDFDPATTSYTASVGNSVSSLSVIPSVNESHATVKVNGTAVVSGSPSGDISLSVGENTITIEVTAQDNSSKTYTIIVTRAAADTPTYTVSFDSNGGSSINSQNIESGTRASEPQDPVKSGYTFMGWYSDSSLSTAFDFNTAITGNITLYAKWNQNLGSISLGATAGDQEVALNWSGSQNIVAYSVYRTTTSGSYGEALATVAGSVYSYEVSGLTNGTAYYFIVKGFDSEGDSSTSNEVKATPQAKSGGAPVLSVAAGNRYVNLSWSEVADTVAYSVYRSTTSGSYGEALATVAGSVYSYKASGLTNGTIYYFIVKAIDSEGESTNSNEASATPHKSGGSTSSGSTSSDSTSSDSNTVSIQVNGVNESAATATTTTINNRTVTTVVVDDSKVNEKLASEGNKSVVTIPVNSSANVVIGQLNGQTVKNMEDKEAVLEIKTGQVTYTLPAAQINIAAVDNQLGSTVELKDINVNICIATPPADTVKIVEDTVNKNNYQLVVKPVEFTITCTSGDKSVEVSKFNGYVERTIVIPEGVDPGKITTGIVLNNDGTFSHVPTTIVEIDGKYYAKINSLTNSTYSVIYNPKTFADVEGHWARTAVNDMASRLVIDGVNQDKFEPDRDISRAEFATIIVKGLGLMRPGSGQASFKDVNKDAWYYDAVSIAYGNKLLSGYDDGTFQPGRKISREEAMAIMEKAAQIAGIKTQLNSGEAAQVLARFSDGSNVDNWAQDAVASCIKAGIVQGSDGRIKSQDNISRAEVAALIERMLKKAGLI